MRPHLILALGVLVLLSIFVPIEIERRAEREQIEALGGFPWPPMAGAEKIGPVVGPPPPPPPQPPIDSYSPVHVPMTLEEIR